MRGVEEVGGDPMKGSKHSFVRLNVTISSTNIVRLTL